MELLPVELTDLCSVWYEIRVHETASLKAGRVDLQISYKLERGVKNGAEESMFNGAGTDFYIWGRK